MAAIPAVCRRSVGAAARQLRTNGASRTFRTCSKRLAASNFTMPAMSPTMTEGNITGWKVKEGDSYSAGDVLLEIETDKAQMDVEAQDDGIVAKITQGDGTKSVKVGSRIAVLAEPGDDVSSLEIPPEDTTSSQQESSRPAPQPSESKSKSEQPPPASVPEKRSSSADAEKSESAAKAQKQQYPLYPSVAQLLHENDLSKSDADKIPASGPQGRLLKGDVLAYLGKIDTSYPAQQSDRIAKLSHLDLSNIKPAAPPKPSEKSSKSAEKEAAAVEVEPDTEVAVSISLRAVLQCQKKLQDTLGVTLPLSTFIARAVDLANDDLPRGKASRPTQDELFNAVLGLDKLPKTSRGGFIPQITALPPPLPPTALKRVPVVVQRKPDVLDFLAGKATPQLGAAARGRPLMAAAAVNSMPAANVFSVTVGSGEERRARVFLERVKTVLEAEPGRLVL